MDSTELKKDMPAVAAIVQRDRETYAIVPHIPGGITNPETLRKIADVAEKYQCKALKLTSAQRIALVGIAEDKLDEAWADLGLEKGAAIGSCVRSVKICPGTTFCKRGKQDSVTMGLTLDQKYHGMEMPSKLKIGVSGCPNSCAEAAVKDIGLMGGPKGYTIMAGGCASGTGRLAQVLYKDKSPEETLSIVEKLIKLYSETARKGQRLGRYLDGVGIDQFMAALEAEGETGAALVAELKAANALPERK